MNRLPEPAVASGATEGRGRACRAAKGDRRAGKGSRVRFHDALSLAVTEAPGELVNAKTHVEVPSHVHRHKRTWHDRDSKCLKQRRKEPERGGSGSSKPTGQTGTRRATHGGHAPVSSTISSSPGGRSSQSVRSGLAEGVATPRGAGIRTEPVSQGFCGKG